ncbi:MAG: Gfo/Idh/MocA family oxidoreductase [Phaeodactylibacter sp.]|uniref:Gfo/Idh/MocA family protein n=1 Tax=Phaeodactylibacter sp. TaxID=1940289 RepID=UPI0032EEA1A6
MHKLGIVGAGAVADLHAQAIASLPNAQLTGCCDGGSGRAKALADQYGATAFTGYQELIESPDVDVVLIATPSGLHLQPVILAAAQGKPVLCEKPLEITTDRIDQMIAAHERAGTTLGCIFNYRYDEVVGHIRQALSQQRLGKITYAAVRVPWWRDEAYYAGSWKGTQALDGGGALMNQSIHMVDLLQHLMGPVQSLFAYTDTLAHDIEVEDTAVVGLRFANGALGQIYGSTAAYPGQPRQLDLMGTKGTIQQVEDSLAVWAFAEARPEDEKFRADFGQAGTSGAADPMAIQYANHARCIAEFLGSLETGTPFSVNGKEARKSVEILEAVYRSQAEGRLVRL